MKQIYRLYGIPCRNTSTPLLFAFSLSFFILLFAGASHAQVNVNAYARVTAINGTRTQLTISNRNENNHTFVVGEEVIVMQMQDDVIGANTNNDANFGNISGIANAGMYEIAVISAINGGRTLLTLTHGLQNIFNVGANSRVQVISFRTLSTGNYTLTNAIRPVAWNGNVGGVVAIQVGGTLTLQNNITADGRGFTGGDISDDFESGCTPAVYQTNSDDYGAKGEGIYLNTNANYTRGRGRLLNGGGGGNDDNAGGAGGGNYTAGGNGGPGWTCSANPSGGLGGIALSSYLMAGTRLFMGGGGGGGQGNNGTQTAGATGGGIIIIKANVLTTNCSSSSFRISANGNSAASTDDDGNDGAGGAGAGGTILFQVNTFTIPATCRLNIQANGGNGGDVTNTGAHGGGGGGGQGAILFANAMPTTNVTTVTTPGTGGLNSSPGGTRAESGSGNANSGIIGGIGIILPVRLLHFSAEKSDNKALLRWTASGEANTIFSVQHSTDGVNFTSIGTVKATGNGNTATNYSYTHANPVPGKNYYQLLITGDPSTRSVNSPIASVNMTEGQSIPVAWPNPAHDRFSVRVNSEYSNKNHQVIVTDLTGKVIYTNTFKPVSGIITIVPSVHLKPGLYMFKFTCDGYEQSGKVMIQ